MKTVVSRPSPAMIVALIALVAALSGTAYAALGKNSVGTRQLKAKAVTSGKIANNAVTSVKVAKNSLTGADINIGALGTVPSASHAGSAGNADTVTGHAASCPGGTVLVRGVCFDAAPNPEAPTLKDAADACAAKGGYLPSPMELFSTRSVLNLGTGVGSSHMYTDSYYSAVGTGSNYTTIVIDGTGKLTEARVEEPSQYICAYALVR
jgi:hypothetical protein